MELIEFAINGTDDITAPLYLDMTTNGSTDTADGGSANTEILLFAGHGPGATFIESNDNDGIGLQSTLSYGAGSGLMLGDSFNLSGNGLAEGENGDLAAGNYTLAIGEFSTADPPGGAGDTLANFLAAGDFGDEEVDYIASFYTNATGFTIIPEPASVMTLLCGLFGLALLRGRE